MSHRFVLVPPAPSLLYQCKLHSSALEHSRKLHPIQKMHLRSLSRGS